MEEIAAKCMATSSQDVRVAAAELRVWGQVKHVQNALVICVRCTMCCEPVSCATTASVMVGAQVKHPHIIEFKGACLHPRHIVMLCERLEAPLNTHIAATGGLAGTLTLEQVCGWR